MSVSEIRFGSLALLCLGLLGCGEPEDPGGEVDVTEAGPTGTEESMTSNDGGSSSDSAESESSGEGTESTGTQPCSYPEGAVEPMALDQVISPYSWPEAKRADGLRTALSLVSAYCDDDAVIDWSPHEVLVFISIPAW